MLTCALSVQGVGGVSLVKILKSQETLLEDDAGNLKNKVVAKIIEGNKKPAPLNKPGKAS